MDGFKRKLTSKFTAIKTQADTHTHVCTPMACALTQTALPKLIYTPSARSILNATQEEYNQTTAWVNQLFANETLDASETGKTFETLGNMLLTIFIPSYQGLHSVPADCAGRNSPALPG